MSLPGLEPARAREWVAWLKAWFVLYGQEHGTEALAKELIDFRQYALARWGMSDEGYERFVESVRREISEARRSA